MPLGDDILDCIGHAVIVTDLSGVVEHWNAAAEELYGWTAAEVMGRPVVDLIVPDTMRGYLESVVEQLTKTGTSTGAFTARRRDGSTFLAFSTSTGLHDESGQLVGIVGVAFNLGDVAEVFLRRSHEAALVTDAGGTVLLVSPAMTTLTGWTPDELVGTSWWDCIHEDDRPRAQAAHDAALDTFELLPPVEQRVLRPDGSSLWVDASKTNLLDVPMVRGVLVTLRDVTERRAKVEELTQLALHDSLTGLVNRGVFRQHLETHVARRQHAGAVLYIDLDAFKAINDRHGHEAGDVVLRAVAQRLRECLRPEDVCGRLGGDEFAILSPDVASPEQAIALAHRVRVKLAEPLQVGHVMLRPKASVGVSLLTPTTDADAAIRLADIDMYHQKYKPYSDAT